jgi:hypothetical protein
MAGAARQPDVEAQPVRVALELDTASSPISGRLLNVAGVSHDFHGWLGLMAAVDAERARANLEKGEEP